MINQFIKLTTENDGRKSLLYVNVENIACYYRTLQGTTCIELNSSNTPSIFYVEEGVDLVTELINEVCSRTK